MVARTDSNDVQTLKNVFGHTVYTLPNTNVLGEIKNATYNNAPARIMDIYQDNVVISAVRPKESAPLLLKKGFTLSPKTVYILDKQGTYQTKGNERNVYFSDDKAFYSIYTPNMEEDAFFELLKNLTSISL